MQSLAQTAIPAVLLEHLQNVSYLHVASLAICVFDHLITLDNEVTYIWDTQHWSIVKLLYIFVRYSTYVDASLNVIVQCFPHLSMKTCKVLYNIVIWCLNTGIGSAEVILTLRVWAVWEKKTTLGVILTVYLACTAIAIWAVDGSEGVSLAFGLQDALHEGCLATGGRISLGFVSWGLLLAYDTFMMLLMLPPAYHAYKRGGRSTMASVVIKDGIILYIYLFALSMANMVTVKKLSADYFTILSILGRVLHSTLSCRVVLSIREKLHRIHGPYTTFTGV